MDKLLGAFTDKYLNELNYEDLKELEKLLEIDDDNFIIFKRFKTEYKFEKNKI